MNDDLLERATRAFRDVTAPEADGADAVLARIERHGPAAASCA
jgi:hypothetical protein